MSAIRPRLVVSPELTLRPLLSGGRELWQRRLKPPRVAGANAPAFVERGADHEWLAPLPSEIVSPELTLRPLLSAG